MKGSIRFFLGLIVCMAAVGPNDDVSIALILAVATVGLALMYSGVQAFKHSQEA